MSHSQGPEEGIILDFFKGSQGAFLDLGANDGRTFSNTHALALLGWSGVCVDASPVAFNALCETYKDRPDIQKIHRAVTNENGLVTLQQASDTLVSSLDPSQPQIWGRYGFEWSEVQVEGVTVESLLQLCEVKKFDFISIDCEGFDVDILRQMDLEAMGCKILCIEHGGRQAEILSYCKGWRIIYGGDINLILAR